MADVDAPSRCGQPISGTGPSARFWLWRNSVGISLWHAPVAAAVVAGRTHEAGRSDCTRKRSLSNAASHGGGDAVDLHHGRSPETWKRDIPPAWPRRHVRGRSEERGVGKGC